ncbi:hypothetical protein NQ315_001853 [Exocentrus adspersus]|uniref:Uncharacterized protein n=1 Tax=Exocentrus adspersus TaxID=1586481 RepID=A0AAV8WAP6_9CUCU|nr:hypothetical protein NQ315_001853 [Exocentrus adspersus]
MAADDLPNTLTPSESASPNEARMPWGLLVPCRSTFGEISCEITLYEECVKIGRSATCDIVIDKKKIASNDFNSVSKQHFIITKEAEDVVYVTDVSKNGTFLNDEKIGQNYMYRPVFMVGRASHCDACIDNMEVDPLVKSRFNDEQFVIHFDLENSITTITDLSQGGTYLNGRLIGLNKRHILQHEDTIGVSPKKTRVYVFKSMIQSNNTNFLPNEMRKRYEVSTFLGRGASGEVRLGFKKDTCEMYAIKKIIKGKSVGKLNHPSIIENEIKVLKSFSKSTYCPFIVNMKDIVETPEEVFLPENVLLATDDTETVVKVSDFGLSKIIEDDSMMQTICGTPYFAAPEVLDRQILLYDKQADVWSLGVLLFYMFMKKLPFYDKERDVLTKLIISGNYVMEPSSWSSISSAAKDLVRKMLNTDPNKRISVDEILRHPWLEKDVCMKYRVSLLLREQDSVISISNDESDISSECPPVKHLIQPSLKLGRSEECDIVIHRSKFIPDQLPFISKEQFLISKDPEDAFITYITDLSKNGTFVNDRLIGQNNKIVLQNNDIIAIGKRLSVYIFKSMRCAVPENYLPPLLRGKYEPSKSLGHGSGGDVRLVYEKWTCKKYAVKNIRKMPDTASRTRNANHPNAVQTEIDILQKVSHPFVISMKEILDDETNVYIILEYMKGRDLTARIASSNMSEANAKFLFYQMALALQYLHSIGITHRDLKPGNILLNDDNAYTMIKIADFGMSKFYEMCDMTTFCGTWSFMAPEVLLVKEFNGQYDKQIDVWSLGVILFYMLSKELPFDARDKAALKVLIVTGRYDMLNPCWYDVSAEAKDLVQKMLVLDPKRRITVDGILNHPWISKDNLMRFKVENLLNSSG